MEQLRKKDNENEEQFIWRLGRMKDSGELDMEWDEVAAIVNRECRTDESEYRVSSAYRKPYQQAKRFYEAGVFKDLTSEAYTNVLRVERQEIKKERQRLSDERSEYARLLREQARRESFIDLIKESMKQTVERLDYEPRCLYAETSDNDMIVCLSDLHAGLAVDSRFNAFDSSVLKARLQAYIHEIREIQTRHMCQECHLVLGGDMVSGSIHTQIRIENNENVIQQVKLVSVLIGDFVNELQNLFQKVHIYSVSGNHSRLSPEKENQLHGEELDALVPFYLQLMFSQSNRVTIHENTYDDTIINFRTRGDKLFYGVHGDKDSVSNVVKNLTLITGQKPDGVIMGHRHYNSYSTEHGVKIIQCGSMVGMDNYCIDHRLSGRPEQCVVITNEKDTVKCLYDIGL